jgi:hypothetical protein
VAAQRPAVYSFRIATAYASSKALFWTSAYRLPLLRTNLYEENAADNPSAATFR